jgi:hypothetical protein
VDSSDFKKRCVSLIFKGQAVQEGRTDRLSQNVANYQPMLSNIPEEQRPRLHCGGSPKLCVGNQS